MSCNCATNEQIRRLYEQFGNKSEMPKGTRPIDRVRRYVTVATVTAITVMAIPFLFIYVIIKSLSKDKSISLAEFFGFRKKITMKTNG